MNRSPSLASRPATRPARRTTLPAAVPALLIAASALLAGCGQKGPLTLPKPPASAASAAASTR